MDLKRTELKYLITMDEYQKLKTELSMMMQLDPFANPTTHTYHIKSLYFDDMYFSHVCEKADGIEYHTKFRLRQYENQRVRLEKKTKVGNLTGKQSLWMIDGLDEALRNQDDKTLYKYIDEPLIEEMIVKIKLDHLKPSMWINYDREAYIYPAGDTRITFDTNITASSYDRPGGLERKILEPKHLILEIKYTEYLPDFIKKVVMHRNYQLISYSKYYMGFTSIEI